MKKKYEKEIMILLDKINDCINEDFNQIELENLKEDIFGFDFEAEINLIIEKALDDFEK